MFAARNNLKYLLRQLPGQFLVSSLSTLVMMFVLAACSGGSDDDTDITTTPTDRDISITSPNVDPTLLIAGGVAPEDRLNVTVAATGVVNVTFTSSIGTWLSTGNASSTVAVNSGAAVDTLIATATDIGLATVVVADAANADVFDSITVTMSPPAPDAALISLQSNLNVLPLSLGGTTYTADLVATVRTDDASSNQPVANVPVVFTLHNVPGGGEVLSSSFGVTDANGDVPTRFTSGTLPTGLQDVVIRASLVTDAAITDSINIAITGAVAGGTITLSTASSVITDADNTAIYRLPMTAMVTDSFANPVPAADVTLTAWPTAYRTGSWYDANPDPAQDECAVYYSSPAFLNEDRDEDLVLDVNSVLLGNTSEDTNQDGQLTPHNSNSGFLPSPVVTDDAGVGAIQLTFLKQYARWIDARVRASANVQGATITGTLIFDLPVLPADADSCNVTGPSSPFDMVVTGAPGEIATIVGAGIEPDTLWTLPEFVANNNAAWNATTGTMLILPPTPPQSQNSAQYRVAADATSPSVYQDNITITADPLTCPVATCNPLFVNIPVKVIVP